MPSSTSLRYGVCPRNSAQGKTFPANTTLSTILHLGITFEYEPAFALFIELSESDGCRKAGRKRDIGSKRSKTGEAEKENPIHPSSIEDLTYEPISNAPPRLNWPSEATRDY
ncbi:hypothetical protein AFLA_002217 [Aspergillus flavus NRRL3357]|nr:hypothetical protein AFLA_002217 [Aspergillus flavus NRRL3357]